MIANLKSRVMSGLINFLLVIYCFLQIVLGEVAYWFQRLVNRKKLIREERITYTVGDCGVKFRARVLLSKGDGRSYSGVSFGRRILLYDPKAYNFLKHELAHSMQSNITGVFYLFLGLLSLLFTSLSKNLAAELFVERWAEKLATKINIEKVEILNIWKV